MAFHHLQGSTVLFQGDSLTTEYFNSFVHLMGGAVAEAWQHTADCKHILIMVPLFCKDKIYRSKSTASFAVLRRDGYLVYSEETLPEWIQLF
jgi:hypothetical protein